MLAGRTILISVGMLAASIWIGSLVCLALVSRVAGDVLDGPSKVALFRGVGRLYGIVGTTCLVVAIVVGLVIAWPLADADATVVAACIVAAILVVVVGLGMAQARRMTVRRRRALAAPDDESAQRAVRRGAVVAAALRGAIAALTLLALVLVARELAA